MPPDSPLDFEKTLERAGALVSGFDEETHLNPSTQTQEFSLRDPDGYYVTISGLSAAAGRAPQPAGPSALGVISSLSVAVVVVVLPVRIPFPAGVLVMTSVSVGVANPTTRTAINAVLAIF
jgi:hypothetical protein